MTDEEIEKRRKRIREKIERRNERIARMTPKEIREESDRVFAWLQCVPDIPRDVWGVEYTAPCSCGTGKIIACRAMYNGHLRAWCDGCGMKMIE